MDTLNLDFPNQTVGRIQLPDNFSNWHVSTSYSSSSKKYGEREKVINHFKSRYKKDFVIHCLSMPGASWAFEMMLEQNFDVCRFVGIEHSWAVMARSLAMMPGGKAKLYREINYGDADLKAFYSPKRAWWIQAKMSTFVSMINTDYKATLLQKEGFNKEFYKSNCAWLDFTGSLGDEIVKSLHYLPFATTPFVDKKPIAITFMYGRDKISIEGKGLHGRRKFIERNCPGFISNDAWIYEGLNNCPMITVTGFL